LKHEESVMSHEYGGPTTSRHQRKQAKLLRGGGAITLARLEFLLVHGADYDETEPSPAPGRVGAPLASLKAIAAGHEKAKP
jgi:hypothetical protein